MEDETRLVTLQQSSLVTPMDLIVRALESGWDVDKLDRLIGMQNAAEQKHAKSLFESALLACQEEIKTIAPDSVNPQANNAKYAKYDTINKIIRPIYTKHGFSISFTADDLGNSDMMVKGIMSHTGGYTREYSIPTGRDPNGPKGGGVMTKPQAAGNAMTYAKRQIVGMIFNLSFGDDNDGNDGVTDEIRSQMDDCMTLEELDSVYKRLFNQARGVSAQNPTILGKIVSFYDASKKRFKV